MKKPNSIFFNLRTIITFSIVILFYSCIERSDDEINIPRIEIIKNIDTSNFVTEIGLLGITFQTGFEKKYTNFDLSINGVKFDSITYKTDQPIRESKLLMKNERGFIVQSFIKNDSSIVNSTFRIESSEDFVEFELPEDINSFNRMYVKKISDSLWEINFVNSSKYDIIE